MNFFKSPIISFKDLNIELCNGNTGNKLKKPTVCKTTYEIIPILYNKWGRVFRKIHRPKQEYKYYSLEEVQQLYMDYIKKHNINLGSEIRC